MNYIMFPGVSKENSIWGTVVGRHASQIIEIITSHFDITYDELKKNNRKRKVSIARQFTCFFLRKKTALTFKAISEMVGRRDHTTAIHSVNTIKNLSEVDDFIKEQTNILNNKINQYL